MTQDMLDLIENKDFKSLQNLLKDMHVQDIALAIEEVDNPANAILMFRLLPKDLSAEVFSYISSESQEIIVNRLNDKELSFIMEELATDDAVDFIEEMPDNVVERALKNSTQETRKTINKFLSYEDDTAGAIMTPEFLKLDSDFTVKEAFETIKENGEDAETLNVLFVTDKTKSLKGCVSIRDLLLANPSQKISEIMEDNVVSVSTSTDQEKIANIFAKYDILVMPVVDKENRIVGIITIDDIMEVVEEEATKDIQQMAGVVSSADKPYLKEGIWETFLRRIPWLMILMVSATFTGIIINSYESTLNILSPLLFACVPMLMDTGGNAGGQSSITIIRGIALDEISFKDFFKVVWKEIRVSILAGIALSIICFAKLQLVDRLIFGYNYTTMISLAVSLALFATVFFAKFVGCMLPLIAKKCKLDPAVVASPFITTIVDALSLVLYCNIAITLLT